MEDWIVLFIFEVIPIMLWSLAWYFENSTSNYNTSKKGYKTKGSIINENTWIYGNKVAAKIYNFTANILFFIIAINILFLKGNLLVLAFIIFIILCADYFIIEGLIKKKFKL